MDCLGGQKILKLKNSTVHVYKYIQSYYNKDIDTCGYDAQLWIHM